jgi:hypothetical protein
MIAKDLGRLVRQAAQVGALLALVILMAGSVSAEEPDGPEGWYLEGPEGLGEQGPFSPSECKNALEIAEIVIGRARPDREWSLYCVYYTKYHYVVMDIEFVGLTAVSGPYLTLEKCMQYIADSKDDPALKRSYYCTRRHPGDETYSGH